MPNTDPIVPSETETDPVVETPTVEDEAPNASDESDPNDKEVVKMITLRGELTDELEKEEAEYQEDVTATVATDDAAKVTMEEVEDVDAKDMHASKSKSNEEVENAEVNNQNDPLGEEATAAEEDTSKLETKVEYKHSAEKEEPKDEGISLNPADSRLSTTQTAKSLEITEPQPQLQPTTQIEGTKQPTKLLNITEGPYSITPIITEIPVLNPEIPGPSVPTYIENYNQNIYIGASNGEILHYVKLDQDYLFVSRNSFHSSRRKPIDKIVVLPSIEKAVVISGGLLSCFTLPEFSPANIGRIKDVWDVSLDHDHKAKNDDTGVHVVVYSTNQIRIINVTPSALRLVKDISYGGSKCGVRRGDFSLVASEREYDLIDLENLSKIPLFPLKTIENNKDEVIKPFILPVSKEEFLLTCGTSNSEPSMGLVVNNNGDISRGTVPMDAYPNSIQIDDLLVIATFEGNVVVYSLYDQSTVQELEFSGKVLVGKLHTSYSSNNEKLSDLIKLVPVIGKDEERETKEIEFAKSISKVESNLVIYSADFLQLLASPPRLERLKGKNIEELETELKSIEGSNELGVVEIEYLNTLIALSQWRNGDYIQCIENLTNGIIDPRLLIHIMGYEIYGDVWLFNGLVPLMKEMKEDKGRKIKDAKTLKFFTDFLEKWVLKECFTENPDIIKSIELTNVKVFIHNDVKLKALLSRPTVLQYDETFEILKSHNKNVALAQYYKSQENYIDTLKIYKSLIDGEINDVHFKKEEGLLTVIDLLFKHFTHDKDTIKETGLWIMSHNSELGLHFFHNELIDLKDVDEMLIISKIEDVTLKYAYLEKLLVRLNKEKTRTNLVKNLRKAELKRVTMSLKAQKKASVGRI